MTGTLRDDGSEPLHIRAGFGGRLSLCVGASCLSLASGCAMPIAHEGEVVDVAHQSEALLSFEDHVRTKLRPVGWWAGQGRRRIRSDGVRR